MAPPGTPWTQPALLHGRCPRHRGKHAEKLARLPPSQLKWSVAGGKQACACFAAAACSRRLRTCPGPPSQDYARSRGCRSVTQRCGCRVDTRSRQQSALQPLSGHKTCQDWSWQWRVACGAHAHAQTQQASARTASMPRMPPVIIPPSNRAPDALPASSRSSVHVQQQGLRPFPAATG